MGGVEVKENHESTTIKVLFLQQCELANAKVHGANRLGGNSLLEIIAFGQEAGANAAAFAKENSFKEPSDKWLKCPCKPIFGNIFCKMKIVLTFMNAKKYPWGYYVSKGWYYQK